MNETQKQQAKRDAFRRKLTARANIMERERDQRKRDEARRKNK